jgi:hypothetical protein
LIELLLLNETIVDRPRIDSALTDQGKTLEYQKLIVASTYRTALVFVYSASVHFAISFMTLKSPTGTPEFNAELARVTTLVWPLITLPAMIFNGFTLWKLVSGIRSLTGLKLEEILRTS